MDGWQKTTFWIAGLATLCGTSFIVSFLFSRDLQMYALNGAALAALTGAAALAASVILACTASKGRVSPRGMQEPSEEDALEDGSESLRKRQCLLDSRLHIDEPRMCQHYRTSCTCWSFCGKSPNPNMLCFQSVPVADRPPECSSADDVQGAPHVPSSCSAAVIHWKTGGRIETRDDPAQ